MSHIIYNETTCLSTSNRHDSLNFSIFQLLCPSILLNALLFDFEKKLINRQHLSSRLFHICIHHALMMNAIHQNNTLLLVFKVSPNSSVTNTVGRKIIRPPSTALFFLSFLLYGNQLRSFY